MRLPDPFTDSVAPGFSEAILNEVDPIIKDPMPDGRVLKVSTASQYWTLTLSYPDLTEDEFAYLCGFLAETKRQRTSIDVLLPQYEKFSVTGDTSQTTVSSGQNGNTVTITDTQPLQGRPRLNSLFKLTGHSKVYKITSIHISPTTNTWTLGVYPDLALTTDGTQKPIFNSILLEMTLVEDKLPEENPSAEDGLYRGVTLGLREDVRSG